MDWRLAIRRNREALAQIINHLLAMAGLSAAASERPQALSANLRRQILLVLRPAESALRRLIVIAACGMKPRSYVVGTPPDFSSLQLRKTDKVPLFPLYDRRKRFDAASITHNAMPRLSVPGLVEPIALMKLEPRQFNAGQNVRLLARLCALNHALRTLPEQARRLMRHEAKRRQLVAGTKSVPPLRPGAPPGCRKRSLHPVDDILKECHALARDIAHLPP